LGSEDVCAERYQRRAAAASALVPLDQARWVVDDRSAPRRRGWRRRQEVRSGSDGFRREAAPSLRAGAPLAEGGRKEGLLLARRRPRCTLTSPDRNHLPPSFTSEERLSLCSAPLPLPIGPARLCPCTPGLPEPSSARRPSPSAVATASCTLHNTLTTIVALTRRGRWR
jgi:hypothetical protein